MNKVVVVGRSNVGKSSVLKLLTGEKIKTGKRPGVTLKPYFIPYGDIILVDMPGFGYMPGVSSYKQEKIKDFIVKFIENEEILFAIQVIDANSFIEIAERWYNRGEIPVEIEMFYFLNEMKLNPIVVANKIDKVKNKDETLNKISSLLGLSPPWCKWDSIIVPFSAKNGTGLEILKNLINVRKQ
jgi:GTP-binding protein EngB required for normal cell division